jgi:hypothetical protein
MPLGVGLLVLKLGSVSALLIIKSLSQLLVIENLGSKSTAFY